MNKKQLTTIARNNRLRATPAERELWRILRNRGMGGFKFVRQLPIPPYIVDFCCRERKVIVELDGGGHIEKQKQDQDREVYLESQGYRVIRFSNDQVLKDLNQVYEKLLEELEK